MKTLVAVVTSAKMKQTVTVSVERRWHHPVYKKIIKRTKKYLAHDPLGVNQGELVKIRETRPLSRRKRWQIVAILKKTPGAQPKLRSSPKARKGEKA